MSLAPFHGLNDSPTLSFERDLQLAQHADELGIWYSAVSRSR
jgi:limonene 1,2-monooxygenase